MFFSYIIPTIGRPSVDTAVNSILSQELSQADFEIIVVNDSGNPLPKSDWHSSSHVSIINTNKCERSFARNSGAAIARGKYLAFLDDDDWILPGALDEFWQLANKNLNAVWLYGGIRIVNDRGETLAEINSRLNGNCFSQIMGGAWAPIQASVIQADAFFEVGMFSTFICGTEDEDLCRQIAYYGEFASTPNTVACLYRGATWSTSTNYQRAPEDVKYSRDLILSKPGTFRRLLTSANSSYWRGRVLRIYLSTVSWNLNKKRLFSMMSRAFHALGFIAVSFPLLIFPKFWEGVKAHHVPESLHFVMERHYRDSMDEEL